MATCTHCGAVLRTPLTPPQRAALARGAGLLCPGGGGAKSPCQVAHNRKQALQAWRAHQAARQASPQWRREGSGATRPPAAPTRGGVR